MSYFKRNFIKTWQFIKEAKSYFRDVLLMHGFLLFFLTPFLASMTRFILRQGNLAYISYDNLGMIAFNHPFVFVSLIGMLILLVISVFFEFTFLLLSIYFIQIRQPISLRQLLKGTLLQLKKIKFGTLLFFLFYFFLVLPITGMKFNSELLSKFEIPMFIMDFIFENRILFIALFIIGYLILIYLAVRFIFALPEMILKEQTFKKSIKFSWNETKGNFFRIFSQILIVSLTLVGFTGISYGLIIFAQTFVEKYFANYSLGSAIALMTVLQMVWLLSVIFSSVGIFFIIIDYMDSHNFLPEKPVWFVPEIKKEQKQWIKQVKSKGILILILGGMVIIGTNNYDFLEHPTTVRPVTVSHRGVDNANGVQNSIAALKKTSQDTHPDYIEMDIQETKDQQFVVYHDFNLKSLTGLSKKPNELNLNELTKLTVHENDQEELITSFDDYIETANKINQKLMIEIKPTKDDSPEMIDHFLERYGKNILKHGHIIQSLSFDIVEELKKKEPKIVVGYIMPFSIVGPPDGEMDFITMEYTTLNASFITSANAKGKDVYAWTPNDEETMTRMMFYGVDGIITDQMDMLNQTLVDETKITYSDKLLYFVIGMG
ncbi:glycerophosphoryl diester phosphodiesterase membrane domain-containing protein [Vagococcus carniphilus]|uniref:Glycerophosphodiester phosphodiesterase n=1 Tax=Vagococcus carniphilus TaxID=218144 RepID=A0A430B8T7_9ENTE|nr:glycerophosphodiester phosphodiesterase [Vagococcus carniphilus]QNN73814.1 glycerophosphodiester phosphodiesterase [Vagococcus carniphilus]RSU16658.1 glycerophosphodiester phosphodiesterase [Vagococcus carniphilus]